MWITNRPDADVFVVYAKTGATVGSHGITAFVVEREFNGLQPLGSSISLVCVVLILVSYHLIVARYQKKMF